MQSVGVVPHAFIFACFSLASTQLFWFSWWSERVEGDLGHPRIVHMGAGFAELIVIGLRLYALTRAPPDSDHGFAALALAHILTCSLMGGALWTWLSLGLARCFVPAALVLAASLSVRPVSRAMDVAAFLSFVCGNVSAAAIHRFHRQRQKSQ
jgi:hypothetical protein